MWILAAQLLNYDLNFAVEWILSPVFSKDKGPKNSTKKSPAKFIWDFVSETQCGVRAMKSKTPKQKSWKVVESHAKWGGRLVK